MTMQQIRYVLGISEAGSFNRAAEKLYVSQPSLTSSVHDLEYELGFSIFNRTARGVTLTKRGEEFIGEAGTLYAGFEALLDKYSGKEKKTFSVSTLYYAFARKAFVEVVNRFSQEGYDFAFREMKSEEVIDDVFSEKSEIGILYVSDANRKQILKSLETKHLDFHHLTECNAFVYLHKNHPLAEKESIALDELSDYHFVTYDQNDLSSFFSKEVLNRRELKQAITAVDRSTVLNLLKTLNGYTFLSGILGEEGDGEYISIPLKNLDDISRTFELGYITVHGRAMNNISLTYIDHIRRILNIAGFSC